MFSAKSSVKMHIHTECDFLLKTKTKNDSHRISSHPSTVIITFLVFISNGATNHVCRLPCHVSLSVVSHWFLDFASKSQCRALSRQGTSDSNATTKNDRHCITFHLVAIMICSPMLSILENPADIFKTGQTIISFTII